jgi:hypothetical protein
LCREAARDTQHNVWRAVAAPAVREPELVLVAHLVVRIVAINGVGIACVARVTRLILAHAVTAVLAFVAADLGLPFPAALLGGWAAFLSTAEVTFRTALLARPYTATDAGILAALLGPRGPAADIGILATDFRGTAAFARRGAILTAALTAGH